MKLDEAISGQLGDLFEKISKGEFDNVAVAIGLMAFVYVKNQRKLSNT